MSFVYTSIILHLYFLTFVETKYTSSLLLSLKINTSILKDYFKSASEFQKKYFNLESLLQVCF